MSALYQKGTFGHAHKAPAFGRVSHVYLVSDIYLKVCLGIAFCTHTGRISFLVSSILCLVFIKPIESTTHSTSYSANACSFRSTFSSISLIRLRVTSYCLATSSKVWFLLPNITYPTQTTNPVTIAIESSMVTAIMMNLS